MQKVDVSISYYGKPYQTMVTLFSLLEKSGDLIDTIFLSVEKKQPYEDAWEGIYKIEEIFGKRGLKLIFPEHFLPWMSDEDPKKLDEASRLSIRYQYALERSDKAYVLILHNDMIFKHDIVQPMLDMFKNGPAHLVGVGQIGQCWNCSAFAADLCNPNKFEEYKPSQQELLALMDQYRMPRHERNVRTVQSGFAHPLPECRLNEYACLIQTALYRQTTLPRGPVPYFGGVWNGGDTAVAWFRDSYLNGLTFKNLYFEPYADHAPFSAVSNGNDADTNRRIYEDIEQQARAYMIKHFHNDQYSFGTNLKTIKLLTEKRLRKLVGKAISLIR